MSNDFVTEYGKAVEALSDEDFKEHAYYCHMRLNGIRINQEHEYERLGVKFAWLDELFFKG